MRYYNLIVFIFVVGLGTGCRGDSAEDAGDTPDDAKGDGGDDTGGDGDADNDSDADADSDSDADADSDSDADADTDADADSDGDSDPEKICGGTAGDTCNDDEYCSYTGRGRCGADGATSTCEPRPSMCATLVDPVCGCDGVTYDNWCRAAAAGWGYISEGECP